MTSEDLATVRPVMALPVTYPWYEAPLVSPVILYEHGSEVHVTVASVTVVPVKAVTR